METDGPASLAQTRADVAAVYQRGNVVREYLDARLKWSWQRLLHQRQVSALNAVLAATKPSSVLELAPGPARLSIELRGVRRGLMVENSAEMLALARSRLDASGHRDRWELVQGDAFELDRWVSGRTFPLAYTFRFIRHFHEPERRQLYAQLRACLAPAGLLVFDVVSAITRDRIERREGTQVPGQIAVYDARYDAEAFVEEMRSSGFEVVSLDPVLRHFELQSRLSGKLDRIAARFCGTLIGLLEHLPSRAPLEWIAVCRRR